MTYIIITENDTSQWSDITGSRYHYPRKYQKIITPGTKVIYYKGKQQDKTFADQRLSAEPHYFGIAEIGAIELDDKSKKKDYYADIKNYVPFTLPILAKQLSGFIEQIPENKTKNYWRDGVREIDEEVYNQILNLAGVSPFVTNPEFQGDYDFTSSRTEGKKLGYYSTYYERIPSYRTAALQVHGYNCKACNFNFEKTYGPIGKEFIHVHHIKPLSTTGEVIINPKTDLIPLCPNCHAIVHRQKNKTLAVEELITIIREYGSTV